MTLTITPDIVAEHGLTSEEYDRIVSHMGRTPNLTELGVFSVMWSEHCSYKSSRKWLGTLKTDGPHVIQGPGENAGVIDIGDGQAAIFKMESHNHPSYIEPYQGAATGVGGIMRDVFTMGARPVANMNALRFGAPEHPKTRHLVSGVVAGIGGYGNCMGVPTVGGETNFDPCYNGNILVNAMCVGLANADKIFYAKASGVGSPVVYVGSKTGRDGIHGATMASAEFDDASEEKRPTVQVGDPFTEKLLLEACLELMASDAIIAIQDMGAAGLTSSSVEMASKGAVGIVLDLDHVPCRENEMTAYEMLLSESQERMLMVLKPGREAEAKAIFDRWGLDFAVIGELTDTQRMVVKHHGEVVADMPLDALADGAPVYDRPHQPTPAATPINSSALPPAPALSTSLMTLMGLPSLASRRWIWEQYDHMVMGDTIMRPGGDAALVRVHGTRKALAIATDVTPRYCYADPVQGGQQAVSETWRNITATGATPLAITNCLNFGNPERPRIMGQFVGCLQGMNAACIALDYPVISGNVSLYNETNGTGIHPTPAIGGVGLIDDYAKAAHLALEAGLEVFVIGDTKGHLGCSIFLRDILQQEELGPPPPVDLAAERKHGDFVRQAIHDGLTSIVHDVSDGGLLVALAEMCLAGQTGLSLTLTGDHAFWFGEDQARYIVAMAPDKSDRFVQSASNAGVPFTKCGQSGGNQLTFADGVSISIEELGVRHESWMPDYMGAVQG